MRAIGPAGVVAAVTDDPATLRAGAALLAAGTPDAAAAAWGTLSPPRPGLVRAARAVAAARRGEWSRARDRAGAVARSPALDRDGFAPFARYLAAVAADPETVERRPVPAVAVDGAAGADATLATAAAAGRALAATDDRYDEAVLDRAAAYARDEADTARSRYGGALAAFATAADGERGIVYRRLAAHVARRRAEERDVDALFE